MKKDKFELYLCFNNNDGIEYNKCVNVSYTKHDESKNLLEKNLSEVVKLIEDQLKITIDNGIVKTLLCDIEDL